MKLKLKLIFLIILLAFPLFVFAESSVILSTSSTGVNLGEDFTLNVTLTTTGSQIGDIAIVGIEAFDVFSTSQSQKFQSINGETQNEFLVQLQLTPKNLGDFQIGPVEAKIGEEDISSNTLNIQVGGENNSPASTAIQQKSTTSMNSQDSTGKTLEFRDELRVPENTPNPFLKGFLFFLGVVLFIIAFLWVFRKYFISQNGEQLEENFGISKIDFTTQIEAYFTENKKLEKHKFFRGLNLLLRSYLEQTGISGAKEKTLLELQNTQKISEDFMNIFQKSYNYEYDDLEEFPEQRQSIKTEILKNIQ